MRKLFRTCAGIASACVLSLLSVTLYVQAVLPDNYYVVAGEELQINDKLSMVSYHQQDVFKDSDLYVDASLSSGFKNSYSLNLKLFEMVPIKQVQVQVIPRNTVIPGGIPFGIKMFTDGVMVVGMSDIQNGTENVNPAKDAGLKVGDVLLSIDDFPLERNDDVAYYIKACEGNEVKITIQRDGREQDIYLQPVLSDYDNQYKAGVWVRDSSAGIGTMTYYNPDTLQFAGLGHAICDIDTGDIMPLSSGEIVDVNISGAYPGQSGKPGELKGAFTSEQPMGYLLYNCEYGIYGQLNDSCIDAEPVPMALKQEIVTGPATILSTISGNKPQSFDIEIEKVNYSDTGSTKNMVIRVTDPHLLAATGGIVQGMSGSPILQDGKLVGAVTHVFVNDPTRGYGIFAENMEKQMSLVENSLIAAETC